MPASSSDAAAPAGPPASFHRGRAGVSAADAAAQVRPPARPRPLRVVIAGQTASGKSRLALDLIEALGEGAGSRAPAGVVNADASQLYRGMDIGTAKLTVAERRGIEHCQLDVLDVREEASVAAYQEHAREDLTRLEDAGRRAVIVGGSGLYVRALTDDLVFPGTDPAVRAALTRRLEREGAHRLWEELAQADPVAAERIEVANTRRVVRALEVIEFTGRPFSATMPRYEDMAPSVHLAIRAVGLGDRPGQSGDGGLSERARQADPAAGYRQASQRGAATGGVPEDLTSREPEALADRERLEAGRLGLVARIQARAQEMFDSGLLEETAALDRAGLRDGPTASRAIGYSQALAVLDGQMSVSEAVASTSLATRQLAARQLKWFRRDPRLHWLALPTASDGSVREEDWQALVSLAVGLVRQAER